ncbi:hypothetical protein [uncultured Alistipes sp.]|uniref:hypothetical protein n=1 Tax=uncultured Alistipes sp. TaxID=538949 RepID=UPI0025AA1372|nr:hypothetical protein [uncultured Alistipes sp.]
MKKLLLFAALTATLTGCSYPAYDTLYYTDFIRYANSGIFVSSITDYAGSPYVAMGDIAIQAFDSGDFNTASLDPQQVLDKVVVAAKQKGANGIIGYSSHYTPGSKYSRGYWYASGVAVHFETMPTIPSDINISAAQGKNIYPIEYLDTQKAEITQQTVDYLIANKMRFIEWTPTDGDLYFDIAEKQHIPEKEFDEKYGDDTRYAIEMMYKDAKKAQRKAKRNQE